CRLARRLCLRVIRALRHLQNLWRHAEQFEALLAHLSRKFRPHVAPLDTVQRTQRGVVLAGQRLLAAHRLCDIAQVAHEERLAPEHLDDGSGAGALLEFSEISHGCSPVVLLDDSRACAYRARWSALLL